MNHPKLILFQDADAKWRWHLIAANGRKVATSGEPFSSRTAAQRARNGLANILHQALRRP